jgi:hypothetical protein
MNPSDALQQDWHLYYDGSWMSHEKYGPGQVVVSGGMQTLYFYRYRNDVPEAAPKEVKAESLHYWWPRAGALNTPMGAIYVTRTATRSMRKSAHGEHFKVTWSGPQYYADKTQLMLWIRRGPAFVDLDFALAALRNQMTTSVAVGRDLILSTTPGKDIYDVVFRGIVVGKLKSGVFMPYYKDAPLVARCMARLREEGIA